MKQFHLEILKKREDSLEKQKAEFINQQTTLLKILVCFQLWYSHSPFLLHQEISFKIWKSGKTVLDQENTFLFLAYVTV